LRHCAASRNCRARAGKMHIATRDLLLARD